ncbi:MAG TPA: hypothetical protein VMT52_04895 [Planctomycetota bacterium]|nr:hypothetical protein [Planctomycetota bacterium]
MHVLRGKKDEDRTRVDFVLEHGEGNTMRKTLSLAILAVLFMFFSSPAWADFHIMRIREVMAQYGGDPSLQFVELEMFAAGQNRVQGHSVIFQDSSGKETGRATFGAQVSASANGSSILVATEAFGTAFNVTPDLILPEGIMSPFSGRVCFDVIDCVAYGAYTGSNAGYGTPAPGFPVNGLQSLNLRPNPPFVTNNSLDYAFAAPTPRRNNGSTGTAPAGFPICFVTDDFADMSQWDQPEAGAGLDLTNCGAPVTADIGFAEVEGGALVITPSADPLPGLDLPLGLTGLKSSVAQTITNQNYRAKFNILARPGIAIGAVFVRAHYSFDEDAGTMDVSQGPSIGINFSFDNSGETSDHLHGDFRMGCFQEGAIDGEDDGDYPPEFLLMSDTEYTIIMDVDGDDVSGPITLQVKLFLAGEEEPVDYLGTFQVAAGLGADPDPDLDHGVLIAAIGSSSSALEVTEFSICGIPPNQKFVRALVCNREEDGSISVTWENPHDQDDEKPITVAVNGVLAATLEGSAESFTVTDPPEGEIVVSVTNASGIAATCTICENHEPVVEILGPANGELVDDRLTVNLDGSGSTDGDDGSQTLSYFWEVVSGPAEGNAALDVPTAAIVGLTVEADGVYVVRLTVTDGGCPGSPGASASAEHQLTVGEIPTAGLQRPSDCNQDGLLNLADAICLLGHLFLGSPAILPCEGGTVGDPGNNALLDSNGDTLVNLADAIGVLLFLFSGGAPPPLGTSCVGIEGCPEACQ